jgi:hypothetical protein
MKTILFSLLFALGLQAQATITITVPGSNALPLMSFGEIPSGTINGTNQVFTVANAPSPTASLALYRNGMLMQVGTDYTLSGASIAFLTASTPQTGDILQAWYQYGYSGGGGGPNFTTAGTHIWTFMDNGWHDNPGTANYPTAGAYSSGTLYCFVIPAIVSGTMNKVDFWARQGVTSGKGAAFGIYSGVSSGSTLLGSYSTTGMGGQPGTGALSSAVTITAGTTYSACFSTEDTSGTGQFLALTVGGSDTLAWYNLGSDVRVFTATNTASGTGNTFALPSTLGGVTAFSSNDSLLPFSQYRP